jgi:hypothetical protein
VKDGWRHPRPVAANDAAAVAPLAALSHAQAQGEKIWDPAVAKGEQELARQLQGCPNAVVILSDKQILGLARCVEK